MVVIDNHVHCPEKIREESTDGSSNLGRSKLNPVKTVEDLISLMTKTGVDKICLFAPHTDWVWWNQHLRNVAGEYPDRVIPIVVVNPRWGKVAIEEVKKFVEWGFEGLKLIPRASL